MSGRANAAPAIFTPSESDTKQAFLGSRRKTIGQFCGTCSATVCSADSAMRFATFETGEIEINYAACGSPEHPLVICLHGFPEYWAAWSTVMLALASSFHLA